MKVSVEGLQVTAVAIKKECRELHGTEGALEEAFKEIKKKYDFSVKAPANNKATFNLVLTVNRDV